MSRYKIKNMGRGFDGLTVEGECWDVDGMDMVSVDKITNDHVVFGDRNVSFPVPKHAIYISVEYLDEIADGTREYSHKNPFGAEETSYRMNRDGFELVITRFQNALSVSLLNNGRTLYAQNYLQYIDLVEDNIRNFFTVEDPEDFIFSLKKMKEEETK